MSMASETSSFLACSAHRPFHEKNLDEWDHALFLPSSVRPRQTRHFFSNGSFLPPPPCQSLSSSDVTLLALRCQSEWSLSFLRPSVTQGQGWTSHSYKMNPTSHLPSKSHPAKSTGQTYPVLSPLPERMGSAAVETMPIWRFKSTFTQLFNKIPKLKMMSEWDFIACHQKHPLTLEDFLF